MLENAQRAHRNRSAYADAGNDEDELWDMWSSEEELLSDHLLQIPQPTTTPFRKTLRVIFYPLAMLSIFVSALLQPVMRACGVVSEYGLLSWGRHATSKEREADQAHVKRYAV